MTKFVEYDGQRLNLTQWAKVLGISPQALGGRFATGWSIERALGEPKHPYPATRGKPTKNGWFECRGCSKILPDDAYDHPPSNKYRRIARCKVCRRKDRRQSMQNRSEAQLAKHRHRMKLYMRRNQWKYEEQRRERHQRYNLIRTAKRQAQRTEGHSQPQLD